MRATWGLSWQTPSMSGPAFSYCCAAHALRAKVLLKGRGGNVTQKRMPEYPEVQCEECEAK